MNDNNDLLSQRLMIMTNPHAGPITGMMYFAELEIIQHCQVIDIVSADFGERRLSDTEMQRCYRRFRDFCETQWANRNRENQNGY